MAFWDWLSGIDWGGVLKGVGSIAAPIVTGYLGQRGREQAYQPGVPGTSISKTVPYPVYGDPALMGQRMEQILGGSAIKGTTPTSPIYDLALQSMVAEGMAKPTMSLQEYLQLVDQSYGPQVSRAQEQAITQTLEKIKPELVGRHGQAGPVIARYAREAGLPLEQQAAAAAVKGPAMLQQMDSMRQQAIQNAIKTGIAAGATRQQIELEVARINQEARQSLATLLLESQKMGAGTQASGVSGMSGVQRPGEYDWLTGLDWGKIGGTLSDWLTTSPSTTDTGYQGTGLEGMPFLGI